MENLLLAEMGLLEQESLRALLLNTKNAVLTTVEVVRGSVNTAQVRTAEIFREAVRANAVALIRGVVEAGQLLDIAVLDHVVLAQGRYLSMREQGLGFSTGPGRY